MKSHGKGLPWGQGRRFLQEGRFHPANTQHVTTMQQGEWASFLNMAFCEHQYGTQGKNIHFHNTEFL